MAELSEIVLASGCFWGAEKRMWSLPGVRETEVGYAGGESPAPTYEAVCSGATGHAEAVRVVFDPSEISTAQVLAEFFQSHDPTQGMRQGNDVGSQYRSAIYATTAAQLAEAEEVRKRYQRAISEAGFGAITTEIGLLADTPTGRFHLAEDYHQKYLQKNPNGYDCHSRTGVACPL